MGKQRIELSCNFITDCSLPLLDHPFTHCKRTSNLRFTDPQIISTFISHLTDQPNQLLHLSTRHPIYASSLSNHHQPRVPVRQSTYPNTGPTSKIINHPSVCSPLASTHPPIIHSPSPPSAHIHRSLGKLPRKRQHIFFFPSRGSKAIPARVCPCQPSYPLRVSCDERGSQVVS